MGEAAASAHFLLKIYFKVSLPVCHKGLLNFPGSAEKGGELGGGEGNKEERALMGQSERHRKKEAV